MQFTTKLFALLLYTIAISANNAITDPNSPYALYYQINKLEETYNAIVADSNNRTLEETKKDLLFLQYKAQKILKTESKLDYGVYALLVLACLITPYKVIQMYEYEHGRQLKIDNIIPIGIMSLCSALIISLPCLITSIFYNRVQILLDKIDINLFEISQKLEK